MKRNLKVDWTEPNRDSVKAAVRVPVKRVLRRHGVTAEDVEKIVPFARGQAEALHRG